MNNVAGLEIFALFAWTLLISPLALQAQVVFGKITLANLVPNNYQRKVAYWFQYAHGIVNISFVKHAIINNILIRKSFALTI